MSLLNDPKIQVLIADLSKGNPGAINVMCEFPELLRDIIGARLEGSEIWGLWKDEAKQNKELFALLLKEKARARMLLRDDL
jgi:hypothetical protein